MSIKNITIQNQLQQLQLNDVELEDPSSFNVFRKKIVISFVIILLFFAFSDKIWAQIEGLYNSSTEQFAGISTLMSATANNDIDGVRFFSKAGASIINQRNKGGATSLHIACREGNFEIVKILIDNGANVNIVDNEGWSPLMRASLAGKQDIVEILLKNGAKAQLLNSLNEGALVHATTSKCLECINQIIENGNLIKTMDTLVLKSQIADAFLVARSQENSRSQGVLESFLDYVSKMSPLVIKNSTTVEQDILPIIPNQTKIGNSKLNKFSKNYILKNQDIETLTPEQQSVYGVLEDPNLPAISKKNYVKESKIFEQNIPLNNQQYIPTPIQTTTPKKYKFKTNESGKTLSQNLPEIANIPSNAPINIPTNIQPKEPTITNKKIKFSAIISEEKNATKKQIFKPKTEVKTFKFKTGKQSLKPEDLKPPINESNNNDYNNLEDLQNKAQEAITPNNKPTLLLKNLDSQKEQKIQPKNPQENVQMEPEETIILIEKKSKNPNKKAFNFIDSKKLKTIDEAVDNLKPIDSENLQLIDAEKSQVIINEELDQKLDKDMEFKANQDNKKLFKFKKNSPNLDRKNISSKEDLIKNPTEKNENLIKENADENIKKFKFKKSQNSEKLENLEYENIQSAEDQVVNLTKEKEVQNIKKFKLKKSDSGLEKYKLLEEENI
jgi:hypothetical protein